MGFPYRPNRGQLRRHTQGLKTSLAIALAHSIEERNGFDPAYVITEFYDWRYEGKHSPANRCVDIGSATSNALDNWGNDWKGLIRGRSDGARLWGGPGLGL